MRRVWYNESGAVVLITAFVGGDREKHQDACRKLMQDGYISANAVYEDMSEEEFRSFCPKDKNGEIDLSLQSKFKKKVSSRGFNHNARKAS